MFYFIFYFIKYYTTMPLLIYTQKLMINNFVYIII